MVSGNPVRLQQVVWNLLSNAIKFTPQGGQVQVSLKPNTSRAELVIPDSGQGISSKILPHIFDRFRQADSSSTRAHAGQGLGLAIVRHLIELHGGSVETRSQGLGSDAHFTIELPLLAGNSVDLPDSDTNSPMAEQAMPGQASRLKGQQKRRRAPVGACESVEGFQFNQRKSRTVLVHQNQMAAQGMMGLCRAAGASRVLEVRLFAVQKTGWRREKKAALPCPPRRPGF